LSFIEILVAASGGRRCLSFEVYPTDAASAAFATLRGPARDPQRVLASRMRNGALSGSLRANSQV
jgi:hypothetical protein